VWIRNLQQLRFSLDTYFPRNYTFVSWNERVTATIGRMATQGKATHHHKQANVNRGTPQASPGPRGCMIEIALIDKGLRDPA
jgi:hypothetical protein